jgi:hypothetical protein
MAARQSEVARLAAHARGFEPATLNDWPLMPAEVEGFDSAAHTCAPPEVGRPGADETAPACLPGCSQALIVSFQVIVRPKFQ